MSQITASSNQTNGLSESFLLSDSVAGAVSDAGKQRVDQIYQTFGDSAREFVNKNFHNSYELIRPFFDQVTTSKNQLNGYHSEADSENPHDIPLSLWIKVWSLYLAILDASCKQSGEALLASTASLADDDDEWKAQRRVLAKKLTEGSVWEELVTSSGSTGLIHPQILAVLASLSIRHDTDPQLIANNLEKFIVSYKDAGSDPKTKAAFYKVLDLYLLRVLPQLGQWEVADSFVQSTSLYNEKQKLEIIEKLKESESLAKAEHQRAVDDSAAAEVEAIKRARDSKPKYAEHNDRQEHATSSHLTSTSSHDQKSTSSSSKKVVRKPRTLVEIVRGSLVSQFDGNAIFRTLALAIIISLSAANPLIRKRVIDTLKMLWVKILQTLSMGFKVSYL